MQEAVVTADAEQPEPQPGPGLAGSHDGFNVHLDNFDGPFDLLLQLISRHQMDISDVALSRVTDDFIAHLKAIGPGWELDATTSFLVVASTLLDLKVVRLLPTAEIEDEGDLALLEARDILFARLLQYRAFKRAAAHLAARMEHEATRVPRSVGLDERFARLLPDVLITLGRDEFARLAAKAMAVKPTPVLGLDHLHVTRVSVKEQAALLVDRLRRIRSATFRALAVDAHDTMTKVARFLALLELYREGAVAFDQVTALGELTVRWTGSDDVDFEVTDEYDEAAPAEEATPAEPPTHSPVSSDDSHKPDPEAAR